MSEIRIGISGCRSGPGHKGFYPEGLRQDKERVTKPGVEPQEPL
ncbi:hypothetical protein [Pseudomonas sp. NPDC008258]